MVQVSQNRITVPMRMFISQFLMRMDTFPNSYVYMFGIDGKEVIFPRDVKPDPKEVTDQYRHTHGSYSAGEMYKRGYVWPTDITENANFRFGKADAKEKSAYTTGTQGALTWTKDAAGQYLLRLWKALVFREGRR